MGRLKVFFGMFLGVLGVCGGFLRVLGVYSDFQHFL